MSLYIYDGDYRGYSLFVDGQEIDKFNTIPDYFEDIDDKEKERCTGDSSIIAKYFNVNEADIKNYLCFWTEEKTDGNPAYNDEVTSYIRKLNLDVTELYEEDILPQYPSVNMVLRQKMARAKIQNAKMKINITVPSNMPIEHIDLCIILGNALDNAIEACMKQDRNREIDLEMFLTRNRLIIKSSNLSKPVEIVNDICKTTKEDTTNHGYGLSNIEKTLEKYNGNMLCQYVDGKFTLIMLILF